MRFPRRHWRTWLALGVGALTGLSLAMAPSGATRGVDVAEMARGWNADFAVRGMKTEPTFVEHVAYRREGDRFTLRGDIFGQDLGTFSVDLGPDGSVAVVDCPPQAVCDTAPPNGFLSTVAVLAALRGDTLHGEGEPVRYAGRDAVCVPLETIQPSLSAGSAAAVVLDPCFDRQTGAVLAHRRRFDGLFGGATLDEGTLDLSYDSAKVNADVSTSARPATLAAFFSRPAS